jgi:hypothetical protein
MNFLRVPLLAALALPAVAQAQFTVYGTYSPLRLNNVRLSDSSNSVPNYKSYWAHGVGVGATYTFLPLGPVHLGLDLRGSTKPGTPGADTLLLGVKAGVKLPLLPIKPYVQASGGYASSRVANTTAPVVGATVLTRYAAYEVLAGVDYPILPLVDLRLIEVGGGKGYNTGSFSTSNDITLFSVSTGVTVHF